MYSRGKVVWSPVELEYLRKHRNDTPIDQLTIQLSKSRTAIINKLKEFDGKKIPAKKNKKSRIGKRRDLNNTFMRSAWEADVARYFNHIGWEWMYEPRQFFFEKEKKGAVSYLPDFYLPRFDTYIEVKGYLPSRDRGALRKFKKYHPEEFSKLKAITGGPGTAATKFFQTIGVEILCYMNELKKECRNVIDNWES